ncbi:ATP-binding protein [Mesoflavibacter zeaxanthinifaciens]|uniref:ATP-binding protein n=1 Tax=Mesoflavibacter zeaxanthinifaciens TaxID=393060 RepID=UPI003A91CFF4
MSKQSVEITSLGIKKVLQKYTPERAISEYIWNGFDAEATIVNVDFEIDSPEFDTYKSISISDNGEGIIYEDLSERFRKFYESNKGSLSTDSADLTRGKNGYGRFTFHKFARFAKWNTKYYKADNELFSYEIVINSDNLKEYEPSEPIADNGVKGTVVKFKDINSDISTAFINDVLKPYLRAEFAWYLELKEENKIIINGDELDYSSIIADRDSFPIKLKLGNKEIEFECKYIRWINKLNDEYSRFYFLNENLELKKTRTTSLNKKGDNYWHSLLVVSDFFNQENVDVEEENDTTPKLFSQTDENKIFRDLMSNLNNYLKNKRRPFLKVQAENLIEKYEDEKVFPDFGNNEWDIARKKGLEKLVKEIYEVEPAVFMKLNKEQKKIFLELLNLVMDSSESESLLKIIGAVVELDSEDRKEFAKILEETKLKYVITTINLIKDRLLILENLKQLVFNDDLKANERDHLQKYIEKHYWIFGEEYRMVCAEEVKFEGALRKYVYILRGIDEKKFIAHPDKYKEMDLFLAGTDFRDGKPHNVIVEIKNPTTIKKLKNKEVGQIKEYIDVVLKQDEFNDSNEYWSFYLIGQDYDDIVNDDIQNIDTGLLRKKDNHCLYVKKWSEITNEVERRLKYLLEKLKVERKKLSEENSLKDILELEPTVH